MKKIPLLFLTLVFLSSCDFNFKVNMPENEVAVLEPFPEVERTEFDNIFVVDENKCKKWNLPITRFTIEYPNNVKIDSAKIGKENYDYVSFQVVKDGIVTEELSIGYSDSKKIFEEEVGIKSAEKLISNLKKRLPNLEVCQNGMSEFAGQENYVTNLKVEIEEKTPQNFLGVYQMFKTHYYPKSNTLNPINIGWTANQNSEIQNSKDFGKIGLTSEIWNTFKFAEK
jgi:hypothetical protein